MMRAMVRASQTKSSYRASVIKSMIGSIWVCLAVILASPVSAAGDQITWRTRTAAGMVTTITHGTMVNGHEFGFVKSPGYCEFDILWLSWSSYERDVQQLKGTAVTLEMNVDGTIFKVDIRKIFIHKSTIIIPTIIVFTNFIMDQDFVDLLKKGKEIKVRIAGPEKAVKLFDIPSDTFSLNGYEDSRLHAVELCEELRGGSGNLDS